jgi:protein tyrosine/serine phosphatase
MDQSADPLPPPDPAPPSRWREWVSFLLTDHGILRYWWTNLYQIAPGVYRSNHPPHSRLARYKHMGIKTILNLRGTPKAACHRMEVQSCADLGLTLVSVQLYARAPNSRKALLRLLDAFKTIEKPFVMHCKSGADRAGLASAFYLIAEEGADVPTARKMLSLRYIHIKQSKTGVLDHVLDHYEARLKQGPIGLRDWIATEYDEEVVRASFKAKRGGK